MYDVVQKWIAAYEQEILRKLGAMEREEQRGQMAPRLNNTNKAKGIKKRWQEPRTFADPRFCSQRGSQRNVSN
jgi:hypothetical protein